MPIITEAELRDRVRQPQLGMRLSLPRGTMFSPSAADFVKQWHIEVVYEDPTSVAREAGLADRADWDKPSVFPVNFAGEIPHCITCGSQLKNKPEHMTQLNNTIFAPKNTDRIRLRGKIDTLQSLCLLVGALAKEKSSTWLADLLDSLAAYCREMMSAEYNERPVQPLTIDGLDEAQLRKVTHDPQANLGLPHLAPGSSDSILLLYLNFLRCTARETELSVIDCFGGEGGGKDPFGLVQAMNRMSSAVYYLELLVKRA